MQALRLAQIEVLDFLTNTNNWTWSTFEVLGGTIPRNHVPD